MSDFIVQKESSDTNQTNDDKNNCYSKNECNLNENENKAVDEFLSRQNWPSGDAKNWNIAVKFLMARKFDVDRAIQLYTAHDSLRRRENLHLIDINDFEFLRDLESGKFTILPFLKNYPVCALFTVRLHTPRSSELTTLRTLIYQLDAALENPDAQRNGIIFIYDMNSCKSSNYDLALSKKLLTLIKGSYPARLNRLFVVSAPFWFKCLVKMLSVLMREKLRDRVSFVTNDEIKQMVPTEILPNYFGGSVNLDHQNWLKECNRLITNKTSTCYFYYCKTSKNDGFCEKIASANSISNLSTTTSLSTNTSSSLQNNNRKRPSSDFIDTLEKNQKIFLPNNSNGLVNENGKIYPCENDEVEVYIDEDSIQQQMPGGMTIDELVSHIKSAGIAGLQKEYSIIRTIVPSSSIDAFNDEKNCYKNRYKDVPCLDETRIQLNNEINEAEEEEEEAEEEHGDDYIHANYVDGYKQKNAYISTQGPLDETCEDFWKMIWQERVLVLVMTTKCMEQRRKKCSQYWPAIENETFKFGDFEIENRNIDKKNNFIISKLLLRNLKINQEKEIIHCQFTSWPDHGIPETANDMIEFVQIVRQYQASLTENNNWKGHPLGPPILVHCSAGIGRTGTFCTIDININRLLDTKKIDIKDTVIKIRSQRALSVQMPDQYVFCYMALIEYAIQENILSSDIKLNELFN